MRLAPGYEYVVMRKKGHQACPHGASTRAAQEAAKGSAGVVRSTGL